VRAAALVGLASLVILAAQINRTPFHGDEGSWISAGVYYTSLIERRDFALDSWTCDACGPWGSLNQQLGKILVGAPAKLAADASGKPYTLRFYHFENSYEQNVAEDRVPPAEMLTASRLASAAFGALCCVALFLLVRRELGPTAAVIATALLLANPLFRDLATRAMTDVPYLAFLLVGFVVGGRAAEARGRLATSAACGLLGGLACSIKVTGILIAGGYFGALLLLGAGQDWRTAALRLSVFLACALAVVYALNPVFWHAPLEFPALFGRWREYMAHQRAIGFGDWTGPRLLVIPARLAFLASPVAFAWPLAVAGVALACSRSVRSPLLVALAINAALVFGFLDLNWERYYLPTVVLLQPFAALALVTAAKALARLVRAVPSSQPARRSRAAE
jgi:hypothetical protein